MVLRDVEDSDGLDGFRLGGTKLTGQGKHAREKAWAVQEECQAKPGPGWGDRWGGWRMQWMQHGGCTWMGWSTKHTPSTPTLTKHQGVGRGATSRGLATHTNVQEPALPWSCSGRKREECSSQGGIGRGD